MDTHDRLGKSQPLLLTEIASQNGKRIGPKAGMCLSDCDSGRPACSFLRVLLVKIGWMGFSSQADLKLDLVLPGSI